MEIRRLLEERRYREIAKPRLAMAYLYDGNEFYRFRAAEALGELCRGRTAREFILRLFWHLSDESGAYCIGAPLGIAEIGRTNPKEFEGFKNKYVSLLDNWEVERRYVAYGIGRLHRIMDDYAIEMLREKLKELKDNLGFVVYAIWALSKLNALEGIGLVDIEDGYATFYDGEKIITVRVRDFINSLLP